MRSSKGDLWKNHPEMLAGEVFLMNASDEVNEHEDDPRSDWESIGWKTKRRGRVAYDVHGHRISGLFPVFVQRWEFEEAGINPDAALREMVHFIFETGYEFQE